MPDISVVSVRSPWQKIITIPPLIVIEILSPEDMIRRVEIKVREYLQFGVKHVWVIDPYARVAYRGTTAELERVENGELMVPGTPIVVRAAELFEKLDRMRAQAGQE